MAQEHEGLKAVRKVVRVSGYAAGHKAETRKRILAVAGRRFKTVGIAASGIATLMKDAGLTNGAFYAHFESKDSLITEVVCCELAAQRRRMSELSPGRKGIDELVHRYLSVEHRDDPASGCPAAAMLSEIGRCSAPTRQAFDDGVAGIIDELATRSSTPGSKAPANAPSQQSRERVFSAYALMIGSVQLARSISDESASRRVLERATVDVIKLFDQIA